MLEALQRFIQILRLIVISKMDSGLMTMETESGETKNSVLHGNAVVSKTVIRDQILDPAYRATKKTLEYVYCEVRHPFEGRYNNLTSLQRERWYDFF